MAVFERYLLYRRGPFFTEPFILHIIGYALGGWGLQRRCWFSCFSPKNCLADFLFVQVDEHVFSGVETICFAKAARSP